MSASGSRARAHYSRKRVVQACLTCRARKSRCDGNRPRCGFCASSDSDCHYPEIETTKLDKGSLQILERIGIMEDNLLRQIMSSIGRETAMSGTQSLSPDVCGTIHSSTALWPNGDIVLTWKSMESLLSQLPDPSSALVFRNEVEQSYSTDKLPWISTSPTVKPNHGLVNRVTQTQGESSHSPYRTISQINNQRNSLTADWISMQLCHYVSGIHSTSPTLDLGYLRYLADSLSIRSVDFNAPNVNALPPGIESADVAILLLAIALGQLTTVKSPRNRSIGFNDCVELALPWLGIARFGDVIKDLQAQLLLTSYFMWTMRHWDAWCNAEAMAAKAEQLLLSCDSILDNALNHRVFWAVAKMQLELAEECQIHRPTHRVGRLIELIGATSLPEPPKDLCGWPNINPESESDAWYYYLAETSSRRLVERIKNEMYSGHAGLGTLDHLSAIYPLACELERQVECWIKTLPVNFDVTLTSAPSVDTESSKETMRVSLWNRMAQLQMLIFRQYIMVVADQPQETEQHNALLVSREKCVLSGARKYIWYAMMFIRKQPRNPKRHYGSWLLARNIWSASLTLVAICNSPHNLQRLATNFDEVEEHIGSPDMMSSPVATLGSSGSLYMEAMNLGDQALSLLRQWRFENACLGTCADILEAFLSEVRRRYE